MFSLFSVSPRRAALPFAACCFVASGLMAEPVSVPAGSPATQPAAAPAPKPAVSAAPAPAPEAAAPAEKTEGQPVEASNLLLGPPMASLPPPGPAAPSPNATINLIRILVAKKILSSEEAQQMIAQAETEAAAARMAAEDAKMAATVNPDDVRVTYVPDVVKNEMREQIKADLQAEMRTHGWTTADKVAEWTQRISMFGDFRMRFEADFYPEGNDNTGAFPNFNQINTGAPFDVSGTQFSPQYNVDQERNRFKLRARIGWDVNLEDGWSAGFRLATGENSSPVTANQGLGVANGGQGGSFSKFAVWLDRAFLKYELAGQHADVSVLFGRFDNPFMATSIIWQDEIGFDGLAFKGKVDVFDGVRAFFTGGMFPIFNTDLNFASNQPSKFKSTDKYLYAAQLGADFKITKDINAKIAAAYYDFDGVEGKLSTPYIPLTPQDQGDTDNTRPSFAQRGNTYRAIRDIIPSVINNFGTSNQYQYFGLASKFQVAQITGRIDFNNWEPYQLSFIGD